jgi:hypothetical protein
MKCKDCKRRAYFLIPRQWCEYHWRTWYYADFSVNSLERILEEDTDSLSEEHQEALGDILKKKIANEELSLDDIEQ